MENKKLSKNFSLSEFIESSTAKAYRIPNNPGPVELKNLQNLVDQVLQPLREAYGKPIKVNSGFRSTALNAKVGGAKTSDHRYAAAADITTGSVTENKKLFELALKLQASGKIKARQIIDEYGYRWVHLSVNHPGNPVKNGQILHIK